MKNYFILFVFTAFCTHTFSQEKLTAAPVDAQPESRQIKQKTLDTIVKADVKPSSLVRHSKNKTPIILKFEIAKSDLFNVQNTLSISIDDETSTLSKKEYEITKGITDKKVTDNSGIHELYIVFAENKENETAKKKLVFKASLTVSEKKVYTKYLTLTINPENDSIANFRYLAYIGTNFDLVDGIKAKNLFFASNIFVAPSNAETTGFYFSLYGNRTSTFRDSINNYRNREFKAIRTDASDNRYGVYETADLKLEGYSDNLGVYIAPLIRLWRQKENFQLYYSPSTEFVWRRNVQNSTWYNIRESQPDYEASEISQYQSDIEVPLKYRASVANNVYDWNLGIIGFFLNHESDRMSIRLNMNTGPSWKYSTSITDRGSSMTRGGGFVESTYEEDTDLFFSGKLWITERYTGITLEAEVTNYMDHTSPFYGVTLSKAIDFGKLASIFQPISR